MNAIAVIYVNEHLESLRLEAQQRRMASLTADKGSLRDRIASVASELRRILGGESGGPTIPALKNYPYGG